MEILVNSFSAPGGPAACSKCREFVDPRVMKWLISEWDSIHFANVELKYEPILVESEKTDLELRSISVRAACDTFGGRFLIFSISKAARVTGVRWGLSRMTYDELKEMASRTKDETSHQEIQDFLERYALAFCQKDLKYIASCLSGDAYIIVGHQAQKMQVSDPAHPTIPIARTDYRFIEENRSVYLKKLEGIFANKTDIDVKFSDFQFVRHPSCTNYWGIQFRQSWNAASTYSDIGYLMVIVRTLPVQTGSQNYIIKARVWTPTPYVDLSWFTVDCDDRKSP
jgi:hypothetical protein